MSFTHLEWQEKQKEEIEKAKKTVEERRAIYKEQREVFEKIQADIQAWNCTSEYEEVKKFALNHIQISMPDCDTYVKPFEEKLEKLTSKTWLKYASEVMEDIEKSISYHEKENEEEIQRTKERQDFIDGFLAQVETASKS